MHSKSGQYKRYLGSAIGVAAYIITAWQGYPIPGLPLLLLAWIVHELIGSDHIRYNPAKGYDYRFTDGHYFAVERHGNSLQLAPEHINARQTLLLEVSCQATLSGHIIDPAIEIQGVASSARQYLERGCRGRRYLNISHIQPDAQGVITLRPHCCRLQDTPWQLICFPDPQIENKRTLIIAPHADDAEIAAFGLYSHNPQSLIVTITAGESEPGAALTQLAGSLDDSRRLKGRLRCWDSIAIPLWAGLKPDQTINLGYGDNHLQTMALAPETAHAAPDRRLFRQFNSRKLASDGHGEASWHTLVQDLTEIILDYKPEVIITPHPTQDAHLDHQYSTRALQEVLQQSTTGKPTLLYYINHLPDTDLWPFGPHGSIAAPPPGGHDLAGVFSVAMDQATQVDKACSLEMMHDLRKPVKTRRRWRQWLQKKLIGRPLHPLGRDPYLRKGVRANELFITPARQETLK